MIEVAAPGEDCGFADVAQDHVGAADGVDRAIERACNGFFDGVFLQADTEVAGNDLDDVFGFDGREGTEEVEDERQLVRRAGELHQVGKPGLDSRRTGTLTLPSPRGRG